MCRSSRSASWMSRTSLLVRIDEAFASCCCAASWSTSCANVAQTEAFASSCHSNRSAASWLTSCARLWRRWGHSHRHSASWSTPCARLRRRWRRSPRIVTQVARQAGRRSSCFSDRQTGELIMRCPRVSSRIVRMMPTTLTEDMKTRTIINLRESH